MKPETKMKHTPTLRLGDTVTINRDIMRRIDNEQGLTIAFVSDRNLRDKSIRDNTAKIIIRAVNNHEAREKQMKVLLGASKKTLEMLDNPMAYNVPEDMSHYNALQLKIINAMEKAITNAEKGDR